MGEQFPHTSRPGHFGLTFHPTLIEFLDTMATALIPGDGMYPSGAEAQVSTFIQDRASETDRAALELISTRWPVTDVEHARAAVDDMETSDPVTFAYLRELVYHGYYSSRRGLAAMADRGYAYHGAPQPLGYRIEEQMLMPSSARGTHIHTEDVTRVAP